MQSIPYFCNINPPRDILNKTFHEVTKSCTSVNLSDMQQTQENSEIQYLKNVIDNRNTVFESIFNMHKKYSRSDKLLPYINLKQFATLGMYTDARYFLYSLKELLQLSKLSTNATQHMNRTIFSIIVETNLFSNNATLDSALHGFADNKTVHIIKTKLIQKISETTLINAVFDEYLVSLFSLISSIETSKNIAYIPYKNLNQICNSLKSNETLNRIQKDCFNSSMLSYIDKSVAIFTPNEIQELGQFINDTKVEELDYIGLLLRGRFLRDRLIKLSKKSLILLAFENNLSPGNLENNSILITTAKITKISQSIIPKTFSIPKGKNFNMPLKNLNFLRNVRQLYTCPLEVIFDLLINRTTSADVISKIYPKFVKSLSSKTFQELTRIYDISSVRNFVPKSVVSIVHELFGMNQEEFQSIFNISQSALDKLQRRNAADVSSLKKFSKSPMDVPLLSPDIMIDLLLTFYPNLQNLLLQNVSSLVNHTMPNPYGLLEDLIPSNVSVKELKQYFVNEWTGKTHLNGLQFFDIFRKTNLSHLAMMLDANMQDFAKMIVFGTTIDLTSKGREFFSCYFS